MAVLPELSAKHEVLILAGGDAYNSLKDHDPIVRIPTLRYQYGREGRISGFATARRNVSAVVDVYLSGPGVELVEYIFHDFKPDVLIADSEALSLKAAGRLGIPRISFDRFGLLVYCRPEMSWLDRLQVWRDSVAYRALFGTPERMIVTGFWTAPPRRSGVQVVGPVIRQEVRDIKPTWDEHLLVYLSQGQHEFTPRLERALLSLDLPVKVYGTPREGQKQNLTFCKISNLPFIEDLASCRAVCGTTGNQLLGEVCFFGKPVLGMPMACVEQTLNADQVQKLGMGVRASLQRIDADTIRGFLDREEEFRQNIRRQFRDGKQEALDAIERFSLGLAGDKTETACKVSV